jgi:diguanylate cyclase (GGDEF)-like protein
MSNTRLMLILILVQQGTMGVIWLGAAALGLARVPAWHFGVSALLVASSLSLATLRESGVSPWLGIVLANSLGIAAHALLRRGVQRFCARPVTDRQHLALALGSAVALALGVQAGAPFWVLAVITSTALAWNLVLAGAEAALSLGAELGTRLAVACATPLLALGGLFGLRSVLAPWMLAADERVSATGAIGATFGIAVLTMALLQHLGLGAMVLTRTVRQLRRLSDHDVLTNVLNRRGLAARHAHESRRPGRGCALLVIDIDHFKRVNDAYGHDAGDMALVAMARTLVASVRPVDLVARTGGEEFCVLMPDIDAAAAAAAAERIRLAVRSAVVDAGCASVRLSCSIGVVWTVEAGEALDRLTARADAAMYRAKASGRDRVEFALPA